MRRPTQAEPELRPVLVVDDDPDLRSVLLEALSSSGIGATGAFDGLDALEKARAATPPCALLLDLDMPRLSGQGVVAAMRGDACLRRIPVITMTAGTAPRDLGADEHLGKPFALEAMFGALFRACRRCALCDGTGHVVGSIFAARRAAEQPRR